MLAQNRIFKKLYKKGWRCRSEQTSWLQSSVLKKRIFFLREVVYILDLSYYFHMAQFNLYHLLVSPKVEVNSRELICFLSICSESPYIVRTGHELTMQAAWPGTCREPLGTGHHWVTQAGLRLVTLLPHAPEKIGLRRMLSYCYNQELLFFFFLQYLEGKIGMLYHWITSPGIFKYYLFLEIGFCHVAQDSPAAASPVRGLQVRTNMPCSTRDSSGWR